MAITMTWTQYRYKRCSVDGEETKLAPKDAELLLRLLMAPPGHFVPMDTLVEWLWPNPSNQPGGPHNTINVMCVRIAKHGINIESKYGPRFKKNRYGGKRLVCRSQ